MPVDSNQKDLTQYDEIILGKIQGKICTTNFKPIVEEIVGSVSEEKLAKYLK